MVPTTTDVGCSTSLAALHPDILSTHILSRLDGLTLAAVSCASSHLHSLTPEDDLWRSISASSWPSITDPLVARVISTFPYGHRSFFSDAYPVLDRSASLSLRTPSSSAVRISTLSLISAVDIYYTEKLIVSRVKETETVSGWFMSSPFKVDLLGQKESVPTPIRITAASEKTGDNLDGWISHLEQNLTLSWILIDPATKRAANLLSGRPVSVQRHWLTGEVQARYAAVLSGRGAEGTERESVCVTTGVMCWPAEGKEGEVEVREVSLQVEDMEGKILSGGGSLGVITALMSEGKRRRRREGEGNEGKRRYEEYEVMKIKCRERKQRMERLLDLVCISVGVTIFVAFWSFILFR